LERSVINQQSVPKLTPPGSETGGSHPPSRTFPWPWLIAALLLALLLAVVLILPSVVTPTAVNGPAPEAAATPGPIVERSRLLQQKGDAEAALERVLRRRAELEVAGAATWAADAFRELTGQITRGDEAFDRGRFEQAAIQYRAAARALDELERSLPERFSTAMQSGREALAAGEPKAAARAFAAAQALQPDSEEARAGREQAVILGQVLELTRQGAALERQGDLPGAAEKFRRAAALDPGYPEAWEGVARLGKQIREQTFNAAMGRALEALDRGDLAAAVAALKQAGELDPSAPALQDARLRLAMAGKAARLKRLQQAAAKAAGQERWDDAERLYGEALQLHPEALFARQGRQRAQQQLKLLQRIDRYLQQPERLQTQAVLDNARELLQYLQGVAEAGPRLQAKREQLARLLERMGQRVTLRLRSDGETAVVIYRVGRFGRFQQQEVELRPGRYTLVGSREGYRDVRREVTLRPGPPVELELRCRERI
jgi:tetratricopeptide (TPR) repeat protein